LRTARRAFDNFVMSRWLIGWLVVLAACTQTVADDALSTCTPLCACSDIPLPDEQHDCVASCTSQFEAHPLGDACVACVVGHATRCPSLADDCTTVCTQTTPFLSLLHPGQP
jgi:hypothetical protein